MNAAGSDEGQLPRVSPQREKRRDAFSPQKHMKLLSHTHTNHKLQTSCCFYIKFLNLLLRKPMCALSDFLRHSHQNVQFLVTASRGNSLWGQKWVIRSWSCDAMSPDGVCPSCCPWGWEVLICLPPPVPSFIAYCRREVKAIIT